MKKWIYVMAIAALIFSACDDDDDNGNGNTDRSIDATDANFVQQAALSNMTEIDFGTLAASKGEDSLVRAYGQMMVTEHTTAQDELEALTDDINNVDWPDSLDAQHRQIRDMLMDLEGYAFDSMYITSQVNDHQLTLNFFDTELDDGTDEEVRNYAAKYRPHIQEHLDLADSIHTVVVEGHDNSGGNSGD